MKKQTKILLCLLMLSPSRLEGVDIQHFERNASPGYESGYTNFIEESLFTKPQRFSLGWGMSYVASPLIVKSANDAKKTKDLIGGFYANHLSFLYRHTDTLYFGLSTGLVLSDDKYKLDESNFGFEGHDIV